MGRALSVFKLLNPNKELLLNKTISSNNQKTLERWAVLDEIDIPDSHLKGVNYDKDNDIVRYKARHYTDTILKPVKVFIGIDNYDEELSECDIPPQISREFNDGYQKVYIFDVIIDFKTNEIFVFTKRTVATTFMNRFKKYGRIEYEFFSFNMDHIDTIVELENVFGAWEDVSKGRLKTKGYFGRNVHKEIEIGKDRVKSYQVEYCFEDETIDLFISKDCRISTHSSHLTNKDLLDIYKHLKDCLIME